MAVAAPKIDWSLEARACYVPVKNSLHLTPTEDQAFAPLIAHRKSIVEAEKRFRVTRLAVAGAIAWELIENPRNTSVRAVGLGKVHHNSGRIGGYLGVADDDTAAAQAEARGYLPQLAYTERKLKLGTASGAIEYIAAIMRGIADAAYNAGFPSIYDDPVILTNVYHGKTLSDWDEHLAKKAKGSKFAGGNPMDIWVGDHLPFLIAAVGRSQYAK